MSLIQFFQQDTCFSLEHEQPVIDWIESVAHKEDFGITELNIIFCSDDYLYDMNVTYLDHHTYTDIITFDNAEEEQHLEGDIFISIDRVRENAEQLKVPFDEELHRVMIHGVLHLIGYGDKTEAEKEIMRRKEDACLSLRP